MQSNLTNNIKFRSACLILQIRIGHFVQLYKNELFLKNAVIFHYKNPSLKVKRFGDEKCNSELSNVSKKQLTIYKGVDFVKRIWICLVLVLFCILLLVGCGAGEETMVETKMETNELTTFPTFFASLEENGLTEKIREDSFVELLGKFRYDGKLLSESGVEIWSNHELSVVHLLLEDVVRAEYTLEDSGNHTYLNYYTDIKVYDSIDGLVMPYGVTFDTTIFDLLKIIGCEIDLASEFVSNMKYPSYAMTLGYDSMCDDGSKLVLYDYARVPDDGVWYYDEGVRYSLKYSIPLSFGYSELVGIKKAGAGIVFDFDEKTDKLCRISFTLLESIDYDG